MITIIVISRKNQAKSFLYIIQNKKTLRKTGF
jgi:hypothetical protein